MFDGNGDLCAALSLEFGEEREGRVRVTRIIRHATTNAG